MRIMRVWLFLVLVLIALSCDAGKKKKKGKASSSQSLKNLFLRQRPTKPPPVTVTQMKVDMKNIDLASINTTDQFYEAFKLPRLKQHSRGPGGSDHSTALQTDDEWKCRIRETVVHLPVPKFGDGFYFPSCATLSRCSGCCFATNLDCVPVVQQVEMEFYHIIPHVSFTKKSVWMDEHLSCACGCPQSANSCQNTQKWNSNLCQCECLPEHEEHRLNCPDKGNFQYDAKSCKCVCKTIQHCDHNPNYKWSDEDCACVCVNKECPSRQFLDKKTCKCVSQ